MQNFARVKRWLICIAACSAVLGLITIYSVVTDDFSSYNHYEVLGIDRTATKQEIRKAFRSMSLKHHPDKSSARLSSIRFHRLSEASDVLMDDTRRQEYNEYLMQLDRSLHFQPLRPKSMKTKDLIEFAWLELPRRGLILLRQNLSFHGFFSFVVLLGSVCFVVDFILSIFRQFLGILLSFLFQKPISTQEQQQIEAEKQIAMRKARERQQQMYLNKKRS